MSLVAQRTNEELLNFVAIACDLTVGGEYGYDYKQNGYWYYSNGEYKFSVWNPLTQDSDAFLTAVMLEMDVLGKPQSGINGMCQVVLFPVEDDFRIAQAVISGDEPTARQAATRRAIVIAAAQIGKRKLTKKQAEMRARMEHYI